MSAERNIVWIASYPKSGNTWVRFMACNLVYGPQGSAEALNFLAPDVHEMGAQRLAAHSGLAKTHLRFSQAMPLAERTAAVVYVVRRPADVLISNFNYARRSVGEAGGSRDAFDRYFESFLEHRGDPRWHQLGMGSWEDNVRSWLAARRAFRLILLKYEDLSANPRHACALLSSFLGVRRSDQEIDQAVAHSSFGRLQEIEANDIREKRVGIFYKPYLQPAIDAGLRFMRSGAVGDSGNLLTLEQRQRIEETFHGLSAELGYSSE
jgi:hypothetical protein